jgi:hypothetical protein
MSKWTALGKVGACHCSGMTTGAVFLLLTVLALGSVVVATLAVVHRGGRGPGDPPASHLRIDPAGFPVRSQPWGSAGPVAR